MGDFSADWLALREPADCAARSAPLTRAIADAVGRDTVMRALDLASGTGSNVRYLLEHLPDRQSWLLVDEDPGLIADIPRRMTAWGTERGYQIFSQPDGLLLRDERRTCRIATRRLDLAAIDDVDIFDDRALVTASALLDLVSEPWLRTLADRCSRSRAAVLFALTYDGRIRCSPRDTEDDTIRELVNRHQRTDKGFGPAVGPDAAMWAERCFAEAGYQVRREPSDWVLPPDAYELQRQLIEGWARAATAVAPAASALIATWRARRLAYVDARRSVLMVGHEDVAGWLE